MGVPGLSRGLSPSSVSLRAWEELLHDLISFSVILQRWTGRTDTQEVGGPQFSVPPATQREDCCHSSGVGQRTATKLQPGQLALQNQRPLKHLWQAHSTCTHTHALRAPRRDVPISTSHLSCHVNPLSTHPSRSQTGGKERKKG